MPCAIDTRSLRIAEHAYFGDPKLGNGRYATTEQLLEAGLIDASSLHSIALGSQGLSFVILVADPSCGTVGHPVGETPGDR